MNTRKQVLLMSGLMMVALIILGIYAAWYPSREVDATEKFKEATSERGAILFARNCRLCHGDVGEGGLAGARLPAAPALNRPDLQGFSDSKGTLTSAVNAKATTISVSNASLLKGGQIILVDEERMEIKGVSGSTLTVERGLPHTEAASHASGAAVSFFDQAVLNEKVKLITNTITCGRVGTAMPAWSQTQGGPLSDEQIRQLMVMITTGRWDLPKEVIDVGIGDHPAEDLVATKLLGPVSDNATSIRMSDVSAFTAGEAIRIGEERIRVDAIPTLQKDRAGNLPKDRSGAIQVQRGVLGTTPLQHDETEKVFKFPEVAEPSINQAACGQTARAPAPSGPPGLIEPFTGQTVEVTAQNIAFSTKQITVRTSGQVRVRLINSDPAVPHNIAFYQSSTNPTPVSSGSVGVTFDGVATDDTAFDVPTAGSYFFRCDVHPTQMTGTFTVQ